MWAVSGRTGSTVTRIGSGAIAVCRGCERSVSTRFSGVSSLIPVGLNCARLHSLEVSPGPGVRRRCFSRRRRCCSPLAGVQSAAAPAKAKADPSSLAPGAERVMVGSRAPVFGMCWCLFCVWSGC